MADALHIESITGVDLDLPIAGPGGRSYAFVIDWHIRLLLSLAWFVVGAFVFSGSLRFVDSGDASFPGFALFVLLPSTAIYLLYHPVLEIAMQGRTPGKRIAGIRIVTQTGEVPGVGALLIRNVLRIIDSLPALYLIGMVSTIATEQSVRIGDMAADQDSAGSGGSADLGLLPLIEEAATEIVRLPESLDSDLPADLEWVGEQVGDQVRLLNSLQTPLTELQARLDRDVFTILPEDLAERAEEVIVLMAHYDHLGVTPSGEPYNGALDNAAGVALALELATVFSDTGLGPARSLVFILTDDEDRVRGALNMHDLLRAGVV